MLSAIPVQSVLALSEGSYSRETFGLSQARGRVYATTNRWVGLSTIPHYHDDTHLSFVIKGGIHDKRNNWEADRASGDLMFFYAGEIHQSIYKVFPSISVNLELAPSYLKAAGLDEAKVDANISGSPNPKLSMLKIYKELFTNDDASGCTIEMLVLGMIGHPNRAKTVRPPWIDTVREFLNENWNEPLSLADMSAVANVHPITISKRFPQFFACTVGEYRRRLKIEKALTLIKTSTLTLTEIAYRCGFADQSHFTRTFKQTTGFSPRAYRAV